MEQQAALVKAEQVLTPKELEAYRKYLESGKPPLALSTSNSFFALFLNGHTCEEIAKLNPGMGLGIVVRARVDFDWDKQREEHIQGLLGNIRQTVQKTQLEGIRFVSDAITAYQKLAGEKFQRYLQTGKVEELGDLKEMSFKTYKDLLELMMKLTGQTQEQKVTHHHKVESAKPAGDRPMSTIEAADFLKDFDEKK